MLPLLGAHRRLTYQHVSGTQSGRRDGAIPRGLRGSRGSDTSLSSCRRIHCLSVKMPFINKAPVAWGRPSRSYTSSFLEPQKMKDSTQ